MLVERGSKGGEDEVEGDSEKGGHGLGGLTRRSP